MKELERALETRSSSNCAVSSIAEHRTFQFGNLGAKPRWRSDFLTVKCSSLGGKVKQVSKYRPGQLIQVFHNSPNHTNQVDELWLLLKIVTTTSAKEIAWEYLRAGGGVDWCHIDYLKILNAKIVSEL